MSGSAAVLAPAEAYSDRAMQKSGREPSRLTQSDAESHEVRFREPGAETQAKPAENLQAWQSQRARQTQADSPSLAVQDLHDP